MKQRKLANDTFDGCARNNLLAKLEPGDIVVVSYRWANKPSDLPSCAIRIANFTRKGLGKRYWTHAAMYLGGGKIVEAFPSPKGIQTNDICEAYLNNPEYKIKILRLKNRTLSERSLAAQKCVELAAGKSYDLIALVYFILTYVTPAYLSFILEDKWLGRWLNATDKYFCSELVADSLLRANIYCFDREPYQIMPAHFDNDLIFETVVDMPMRKMGWIVRLPNTFKAIGYGSCLLLWVLLAVVVPMAGLFAVGAYWGSKSSRNNDIDSGPAKKEAA